MTLKIIILFLFGIASCTEQWTCGTCTFEVNPEYKDPFTQLVNALTRTQCPMCQTPRPAAAAAPGHMQVQAGPAFPLNLAAAAPTYMYPGAGGSLHAGQPPAPCANHSNQVAPLPSNAAQNIQVTPITFRSAGSTDTGDLTKFYQDKVTYPYALFVMIDNTTSFLVPGSLPFFMINASQKADTWASRRADTSPNYFDPIDGVAPMLPMCAKFRIMQMDIGRPLSSADYQSQNAVEDFQKIEAKLHQLVAQRAAEDRLDQPIHIFYSAKAGALMNSNVFIEHDLLAFIHGRLRATVDAVVASVGPAADTEAKADDTKVVAAAAPDSDSVEDLPDGHKYLCPISLDLMEDPILATDVAGNSHNYDETFLRDWLINQGVSTSPMTNEEMQKKHGDMVIQPYETVRNDALRQEIQQWKEANGVV